MDKKQAYSACSISREEFLYSLAVKEVLGMKGDFKPLYASPNRWRFQHTAQLALSFSSAFPCLLEGIESCHSVLALLRATEFDGKRCTSNFESELHRKLDECVAKLL